MDNQDIDLYNKRKQTVYEFICDDDYPPMKFKEMCTFLQVPGDERQTFLDILNDLTDEGLIIRSAKGRYQKVGEGTYKGTFIGNQRGFGFVRVEGMKEDFFVPEKNTMGAFHGDTVLIRAEDRPKGMKQEATVIKVLERGLKRLSEYIRRIRTLDLSYRTISRSMVIYLYRRLIPWALWRVIRSWRRS